MPPSTEFASPRIQRLAANFGLAVISAAVFFGSLELGLRLYDRVRSGAPMALPDPMQTLYRQHPYLPIALKPSSDYRDNDTAGHINALGMRGPERRAGKASGSIRVICVGGSTTFGAGILGDENTYPARLEAALREANPGADVEVWNAGVPGYTTAENVIYMSLRLVDFHPDLFVLYEGYNDFKPNRYPGFESDYSHWRDRAAPPARDPLERVRTYTKLRSLWTRIHGGADAEARDPRSGEKLRRWDTVSEEGLETFRRNLRTMIAVARSAGASVALATFAHPCTDENLKAHPGLFSYLPGYLPNLTWKGTLDAFDRYNDTVRSVAGEEHVLLADAARAVPPDAGLFVDHVHFNPKGADLFARVVAGSVEGALRREAGAAR
jgi:lysophospholipase L1-like esterase